MKARSSWSMMMVIVAGSVLTGCATTGQRLHSAIESGDLAAAKQLIASGADVNDYPDAPQRGVLTPLLDAVFQGNTAMVEVLVDNGADPNKGTLLGTPLSMAYKKGHRDIVAVLLKSKSADVNAKGFLGMTPLHTAAKSGDTDLVKLLVQRGADVNARLPNMKMMTSDAEPEGITPLGLAIKYGRTGTADYLRSVGAKE